MLGQSYQKRRIKENKRKENEIGKKIYVTKRSTNQEKQHEMKPNNWVHFYLN